MFVHFFEHKRLFRSLKRVTDEDVKASPEDEMKCGEEQERSGEKEGQVGGGGKQVCSSGSTIEYINILRTLECSYCVYLSQQSPEYMSFGVFPHIP